MMSSLAFAAVCLLLGSSSAGSVKHAARQSSDIPDYVTRYAPLVHIAVNDPYFPSDIGAQVEHTIPENNFTKLQNLPKLDLNNLATINSDANCTVDDFGSCLLFLTSKDNVTTDPAWLHGVVPDAEGATNGAISCAVIVNDHGNDIVDAYYFFFYAFNQGLLIGDRYAGNHVGDWEHTMIRFNSSKPYSMWYSVHSNGYAYSFDTLQKQNSRPLVYPSLGGHANYPTPGLHVNLRIGALTLNDTTSIGPLWDPVKSAYFYTFTPTSGKNGTFTPAGSTPDAPVSWLYFAGKWGDQQYPDSDPRQFNFLNIEHTWDSGPTGPLDKDLNRTNVCPDDNASCSTSTTLPPISGDPTPSLTISRTRTATVASTTAEGSPSGGASSPSGGVSSSPTSTNSTTSGGARPSGYLPPSRSSSMYTGAAPTLCPEWASMLVRAAGHLAW